MDLSDVKNRFQIKDQFDKRNLEKLKSPFVQKILGQSGGEAIFQKSSAKQIQDEKSRSPAARRGGDRRRSPSLRLVGELSRLIGLKRKALDPDEKKTYEDRAKAKVAEATKILEAKQKEEEKRKKESEMETESIGSDSNQGSKSLLFKILNNFI